MRLVQRVHPWLLAVGLLASLVLLGRLTFDLSLLHWAFFVPTWAIFLGAFGMAGANVVAALRGPSAAAPPGARPRAALALAIPVGFVASTMDCMGLELSGCTPVCNFLVQAWTPVVGLLALAYLFRAHRALLFSISAATLVYLIPNCVCYNPINGPWIDLLGRSPACFAASFGVSVIAASALYTGRRIGLSIAACWLIDVGMLGFWVGHHYFDFPW